MYNFIKNIEKTGFISENWLVRIATGPIMILMFSILTFLGIRKMKTSCTILFSTAIFSGYLRFLEIITRQYTVTTYVFYFISTDNLAPLRAFVIEHKTKILISLAIISIILGRIAVYITNIGRACISALITFHARDNRWFERFGDMIGIDNFFFEIFLHLLCFITLFIITGYIFDFIWAVIFAITGSVFMMVTLDGIFGFDIGIINMFKRDEVFFVLDVDKPGFLFILLTALLGIIFQLLIKKK